MSATRFCLVRHGETAWNAEGRVQGQLDVPLSEVGRAQARAVATALAGERFDAIYASDLIRVRQTAAPAAERLGLPVALDAALRERHYGMFERLTYAEVRERYPDEYARFRDKDPDFDFVSGEALKAFERRALACIGALVEGHAGRSLLVFTHGGVLEMIYRHATGRGLSSARDFEIPNAALNRLEARPGAWRVTAWAEVGHLERVLDDLPG
ncbi:MAG: histidine phosphatase family protein [Burkholderiales bacterium]